MLAACVMTGRDVGEVGGGGELCWSCRARAAAVLGWEAALRAAADEADVEALRRLLVERGRWVLMDLMEWAAGRLEEGGGWSVEAVAGELAVQCAWMAGGKAGLRGRLGGGGEEECAA
jgi:hypothetical protein